MAGLGDTWRGQQDFLKIAFLERQVSFTTEYVNNVSPEQFEGTTIARRAVYNVFELEGGDSLGQRRSRDDKIRKEAITST